MSHARPTTVRQLWSWLTLVLIALGIACSAYLLARHFAGARHGSGMFDICQAIFGGDCDAAMRNKLAVQFGIPLAGWGLVHFAVVTVALLLARALGPTFRAVGTLVALAMCFMAAVFGIVLTGVMLADKTLFCPLCVIVHVINALLVVVILLGSGETVHGLLQSLGSGFKYLAGADAGDAMLVRWKITGLATLGLVAIVTYQWVLIQSDRRTDLIAAPVTFEQVLAEYESTPLGDVPILEDDPRTGPLDARLQLILFSDFQCPACQRFARIVAHTREHHPELTVVFKHYPLGAKCNPGVGFDLHPLSCAAACAAEAASRQGKFWEYHDALFASKHELDDDLLKQAAKDVGLDVARFETDLADPATKSKVNADIALGNKLKIAGTPTAVLNGRILSTRAMTVLDELTDHLAGH